MTGSGKVNQEAILEIKVIGICQGMVDLIQRGIGNQMAEGIIGSQGNGIDILNPFLY